MNDDVLGHPEGGRLVEGKLQDRDLINRRNINAYEVKCGTSVSLIRENEDDLAIRQCEQASIDEEIQYVGFIL